MPVSALPVIEKLEWLKEELGSWLAVSHVLCLSREFIWDVLNGRRDPGPKLLKALQFEKQCELVDLDPERKELVKMVRESR